MSLRGFGLVLACAVALGVLVRFLASPPEAEAHASEIAATEPPRAASGQPSPVVGLEVRSAAGFALDAIEVHDGERWVVHELAGGRWAPPGPGPWRVRARGHLEASVEGAPIVLEPDALFELIGPAADLDAFAAAYAPRPTSERARLDAFVRAERVANDRWALAAGLDLRLRTFWSGPLDVAAALDGGRTVAIAWNLLPGARCVVDLNAILAERAAAPLALRVVDEDGVPVTGALVRFADAARAVRYRPMDGRRATQNCARVDVEPTPGDERATDDDGRARWDGVASGAKLGLIAVDPRTGAWNRIVCEHDGSEVDVALTRPGVVVRGSLALPDGVSPERADVTLAWRPSIEGVGEGLALAENRAAFAALPLGADGSFRIATTGPRTGDAARWELTVEIDLDGYETAHASLRTALETEVALEPIELEPALPAFVVRPLDDTAFEPSSWIVTLGGGDVSSWRVRPGRARSDGTPLYLRRSPDAEGYEVRGAAASAPFPESVSRLLVLEAPDRHDRWFRRLEERTFEELSTTLVRVRARVAVAPPAGATWPLRLVVDGVATDVVELGPEWLGETWEGLIVAPTGAALSWSDRTVVPVEGATLEIVIR